MEVLILHRKATGVRIGVPVHGIQHMEEMDDGTHIMHAMLLQIPGAQMTDPQTGRTLTRPMHLEQVCVEDRVIESVDEIQRLLYSIHLWHEHGDASRASGPTYSAKAREVADAMKPRDAEYTGPREGKVYIAKE